jgi:hypothetical protein
MEWPGLNDDQLPAILHHSNRLPLWACSKPDYVEQCALPATALSQSGEVPDQIKEMFYECFCFALWRTQRKLFVAVMILESEMYNISTTCIKDFANNFLNLMKQKPLKSFL